MYQFQYERPQSLSEAKRIFSEDVEPRLLAGGQTLLPVMKHRLTAHSTLIDLQDIEELYGITIDGKELVLGAMSRHSDVAASEVVKSAIPALSFLASGIGDPSVRNRGTIGGSLANNDPGADYPAAVLALGATIVTDERRIDAADFFDGMFATVLRAGEIITAVRFPISRRAGYCKIANPASGYVMAGAFVVIDNDGQVKLAVNGVGECAFRFERAEEILNQNFSVHDPSQFDIDEDILIDDPAVPAAYKKSLVPTAINRAIVHALSFPNKQE